MLTTLKIAAALLVLAFCVFKALRLKTNARGEVLPDTTPGRVIAYAVVALAFLLVVLPSIGQVDEGERGVVLNLGAATGRTVEPGMFFVKPFVESVDTMSVRTQAEAVKAEGASKDLQVVHAEITCNYSLDPARVVEVYKALKHDALLRVIRPAIEEAVKAATADFKAEELITHRGAVKDRIYALLRDRLAARGFLLDAINITDFDFSDTFNRSIEEKVTATQSALKAENDLARVKAEAAQSVERAEAEAKALKAQRDAVTPALIELRRVEALLKSIEKWDGHLPATVMSGGNGTPVPVLDVFRDATK